MKTVAGWAWLLPVLMMGGLAMATEEPRYTVVREFADVELRRYEPQLLAETEVKGSFDQVGNPAFRILADFIFGNNQAAEKIPMTAPVSQSSVDADDRAGQAISQATSR